ncbi:zinc-dependent alcohol dehydrogenase family protein [Lacibacterium aquatile]|uniref:Zinc-dependent alcohol dehydrogenase family protein n=1 Tax=Lacibacterium aquatile TaxID=1168082 RepID=A0ABW5DTR8_9PROT
MPRIVRFHELGGPEVLRIEQVDILPPGPGEIQIRVKALGLNRAEALMRAGQYLESPALPSSLGFEAAGEVASLGLGVDGFRLGDAVSVIPPLSQAQWPTYAEIINFPAYLVVKHPESLGWEAAAALWMPYLTAYGALVDIARAGPGDFIAITAASSSVGLAAIQIARQAGAHPIAITRTSAKVPALREQGATDVIACQEQDLAGSLNLITGGKQVRVVLDAVGGPNFTPLADAMAPGGILFSYGGLSGQPTPYPLAQVLAKNLTLRGYLVHEITGNPAKLDNAKRFILEGLRKGDLTPVIDKIFPFDEIADAHRHLESNQQFGKIVVRIAPL